MSKAVFCIAKSEAVARDIVDKLKTMGFSENDISVLLPDRSGTRDFAYEQHTKAPEGATAGGLVGATAGGVLGLLAGLGTLAIPGIGPFIAAGPVLSALAGIGAGGATGGLLGALAGMGIPEFEAKRYEGKIREGHILISVHTEDAKQRARAKDVMDVCGADDVTYTGEASLPRSEVRSDKLTGSEVRRDEVTASEVKRDTVTRSALAVAWRAGARGRQLALSAARRSTEG
jgi:hypothetical protein